MKINVNKGGKNPIGQKDLMQLIIKSVITQAKEKTKLKTIDEKLHSLVNLKQDEEADSLRKEGITLAMKFIFSMKKESQLMDIVALTAGDFHQN